MVAEWSLGRLGPRRLSSASLLEGVGHGMEFLCLSLQPLDGPWASVSAGSQMAEHGCVSLVAKSWTSVRSQACPFLGHTICSTCRLLFAPRSQRRLESADAPGRSRSSGALGAARLGATRCRKKLWGRSGTRTRGARGRVVDAWSPSRLPRLPSGSFRSEC